MSSDPIRRESRILIAAAQKTKCLLERRDVPGTRYTIHTGESVGQDGDNVLLDDDRHLRFIDPIIGFKHPLLAMLSKSLETDAEVDALTRHVLGVNNM